MEPSTSVNRNVTVPDGRITTGHYASTSVGHRPADPLASFSPSRPASTLDYWGPCRTVCQPGWGDRTQAAPLLPGDLTFTGTHRVGIAPNPARFLTVGNVSKATIESIRTMITTFGKA